MKKLFLLLLVSSTSIYTHEIPDRFIGQSVTSAWKNIHSSITSFFEKKEPEHAQEPSLSPFQKLFRQTITFTTHTKNVLSDFALAIIHEAQEKAYSLEQAAHKYIERIENAGQEGIKTILFQTLDIDLDRLMPSLNAIHGDINRLKQTVPKLKKAAIRDQFNNLMSYLSTVQKHAKIIQKAGIAKLGAQLASQSFSNEEKPLVTSFHEVYDAYPTVVTKINALKIPDAGMIAHNAFNTSSEMVEQMIFLHKSTGKIGHVLIDHEILYPLDSLKNQIRKLGNAIEFVTSTQPVIVVAPPTTHAALMEILKTFVWRGGFSLKKLAEEKVERLTLLTKPIKKQVRILSSRLATFQALMKTLQQRIHQQFVVKLNESPFINIPIAPKILLDIVEKEMELLKSKLVIMMYSSLVLTYRVSEGISLCAALLGYADKGMGATDGKPFIHHDIIRGITFVAEDSVGFTNIIINATEALKEFNPLPFRDEPLDLVERL